MSGWSVQDLLPGLYLFLLGAGLAAALWRWYDPVPRRVLALFGLLLLVLFGRVLFGGGVLLPLGSLTGFYPYRGLPPADPPTVILQGDLIHQITPWTVAVRQAFWEGHWPLWNARAGAGMPLLADPQAQVLQPLVAAAYPFPIAAAVGITAALRVLLTLVFSFLVLRRLGLAEPAALAGSLAFGLGGFSLLWLGWPVANCSALLPAVLYGIVRCDGGGSRDLVLLFLATVALLLAGQPEVMLYALAFAGVFLLGLAWRRRRSGGGRLLVRSALAMALAGGVASPVLLPALEYLPKTERAAVVLANMPPISFGELWRTWQSPETLGAWKKLALEKLLPVVAPRAFGDFNYYWGDSNAVDAAAGYVGSAALLAAGVALFPLRGRSRFAQERLALAALLVALLLVAQPPGLDRLMVRLPVIGATFVHQCRRLLLVISFCLAALAACELGRRMRGEGARWPVLVWAAALAALVTWGYAAHPNPHDPSLLADFRHRQLAIHLVTLGLATPLLLIRSRGRWGRAVPWLFCGLVAGELLLVHLPAVPPAPRRLAWPVTPPVRFLQENLGDWRMVGIGEWALPANFYLMYGLNDVRIDNPSLPLSYAIFNWPLRRDEEHHLFSRPRHAMYDLLGVRYVMTEPNATAPTLRLVLADPQGWIWERHRYLPRLFLPERAVAYDQGPWLEWLEANRDFAKRSLVLLIPDGAADWRAERPEDSGLALFLREPEHVHARAHLAEPRLLASSILQDGHWLLLADGKRLGTVLADGPFVAAWLPAGEHRVDLLYRPGSFLAGSVFAALALAAGALWWVPRPRAAISAIGVS
ncbi:MAG TPA: YfhO family protein [Thermoanaerobaculia bacterium]|nr:YfhO family protein [Thermoanaerobaculia bacterium]